jgi:stage V sporulation protein G
MEITEVKVFPIQEEKLKAFVSIVFDQCFMVNDIKIIQGRDGLFISMPSRKKKNGEFKDVAHPLNNETRRMIEDKVLVEYERVLGERGEQPPVPAHQAHLAPPSQPARLAPAAQTAAPWVAAPAPDAPHRGTGAMDGGGRLPAVPAAAIDQGTAGGAMAAAAAPGNGPAASAELAAAATAIPAGEKTLEEIEEMHLRDSFWTVT